MADLDVSDEQIRQMISNKAAAIAVLSPQDFLRLTTMDDESMKRIIAEAKSLVEYNAFTRARASIIPPYLKVEVGKKAAGRIYDHEGRHRAAALMKAGGTRLPVFLIPSLDRYAVRTIAAEGYRFGRPVKPSDFPNVLKGQFRLRVHVPVSGLQEIPQVDD